MVSRPKISVIITAYNYGSTLKRAATSVLSQSLQDSEIIIVNDCSNDDTAAIARQLADQDPRIVVYTNRTKLGPDASFNLAASKVTGHYVCTLDADDWLPPDSLLVRYDKIIVGQVDAVMGGLTFIQAGKANNYWPPLTPTPGAISQFLNGQHQNYGLNIAAMLYDRKLFATVGLRDVDSAFSGHNDYEFCLRVLLNRRTSVINQNTYNYNFHSGSYSTNLNRPASDKIKQTLTKHYSKLFQLKA